MSKIFVLPLLAASAAGQTKPAKELVALETQFFSTWKDKSLDAVQTNVAPEGISWSEWGVMDKAAQLANQKTANANCTVHGYELKEVRMMSLTRDSAMLVYAARQDVSCGGGSAPSPVMNSSLWVRRGGRWLNVYRASVLPKH